MSETNENQAPATVGCNRLLADNDYYLCGEPGMPTRIQWNAFRRGEAAHKRGAELADNPFVNENLNNWWMMGWEHAAHPVQVG